MYYANSAPPEAFADYDLVVLDSSHHPPLAPLRREKRTLLGYLSLGEVDHKRPFFQAVRDEWLLIRENPDWPGSFYVDIRDLRWQTRVLDELLPAVLAEGFDGVFLDTLDSVLELERREPVRYSGMTEAAAQLVRQIRARHPGIKIMVNRAFELLPRLDRVVDIVLAESIYADYDFATGNHYLIEPAAYREQAALLAAARQRNPALRIMTLDYWNPADRSGIARIYRAQREQGFEPYVATVKLDQLVREPRCKD